MAADYRSHRDRIFGVVRDPEGRISGYVPTPANTMERALLLALVEFLPNVQPSRQALALMLGTTERQVSRLLRACEAKGLLSVRHTPGQRSRYTFTDPGPSVTSDAPSPLTDGHPYPGLTVTPDGQSPLTVGQGTPDGRSGGPLTDSHPKQTNKADKKADKREPHSVAASSEPSKGKRRKPSRPLPEDWTPNAAHRARADERGVDLDLAAEKFRGHAQANDRRCVDWDAAFRNWLLNERPSRPGPRQGPVPRGMPKGWEPAQGNYEPEVTP